ncbi:hypothetical protein GIB67_012607 [Kingdonia uniflora]|uniref:ABC transporter domain-containing protein n=1 Tax=Kingdonia uniflora TaxID=39325 RepID=A0A7J7NFD5_9MAGN|nr:hypothetical protein GIB67_012607 [Kingdonia uniflora]
MKNTSIEVSAMQFTYDGQPQLFVNFNLNISPGSRCLLVGANGSGKTTLLKILAGKHMVGGRNVVRVLNCLAFHDTKFVCDGDLTYLGGSWSKTIGSGEVPLQGDFSAEHMIFGERLHTISKQKTSRQLSKSIQVVWGESSMIAAEILLFGEALEDVANQRFVLRSDSCVPLHNFSYIYNYVMSSSRSFIDSFVDVKGDRYHLKMSSIIPKDKWRKGSKWIALVRRQAEVVVDDDIILPVFKKYCKRRPPIDHDCIRQVKNKPSLDALLSDTSAASTLINYKYGG